MSHHHYYSGDYVTLGNVEKYPIDGYGTMLVRLRGRFIYKWKVFYVPGLTPFLYLLLQNLIIKECGYIGDNKGTNMWFPPFNLTIYDRMGNLVTYKSTRITYRHVNRDDRKSITKSASTNSVTTYQPTMIPQDLNTMNKLDAESLIQ